MTQPTVSPADTLVPVAGSWVWPLLRGITALAVGIAIAFTSHLNTPSLALAFLAIYTLITGILQFFFLYRKSVDPGARIWSLVQATINTVTGLAAGFFASAFWIDFGWASYTTLAGEPTALSALDPVSQTRVFVMILLVWAVLTAFIELFLGLSRRKKIAEARDWIIVGVLSASLAVVTLLIDPALRHQYVITDKTLPDYHGAVTGSIASLGFFGIYLVAIGIFLLIGMVSLKHDSSQAKAANG